MSKAKKPESLEQSMDRVEAVVAVQSARSLSEPSDLPELSPRAD